MSGLNISNYLSQTTGYDTSGNDNISSLFSSLNSSNNKNSVTDILGISYTDYASIKSGSYYKLMQKTYSSTSTKASDEDIEKFKKQVDITSDKAAKLTSALDDLLDMKYTEDNRASISDKVKSFVDAYNSTVTNAKSSDLSSVQQKADWMTNMVSDYSNLLSSVGITINGDKTLSVDSEALSKANMTTLKDAFGAEANSFANKAMYKAEQIYSLAKTYGSSATAYTSSGAYNRDYSSNYDITT